MSTVGKNIKHFRKKNAMSQDDMAEQLHVTRQIISHWETGKAFPDIDTLKRIATILDINVTQLIYAPEERQARRIIDTGVSVKPVLVTPVLFFLLMFFGMPFYGPLFERTAGGGVAETYLYPIYSGQIAIATLLVLCTCIVVDEIRRTGTRNSEEDERSHPS